MYEIYEYLKDKKIALAYLGLVSDSMTDKFISLSEHYLKNSSQLSKLKNKVPFLIAECFQNTVRHSEKKIKKSGHKDFFQINAWDDGVVLSTCNLIEEKNIDALQKSLWYVNSLGKDELKKLHDEVLKNGVLSNKGGAGLGLIDMAKKSGLPLRYNFNPIENNMAEFFLGLEVINPKETAIHIPKISLYLKKEIDFYKNLVKKNVLLLYKGEFSKEIIQPLVEMMDYNLVSGVNNTAKEKKRIITIIEVLQNISKHAKLLNGVKPGIFSISSIADGFVIEGGNFVPKEKMEALRGTLDALRIMNPNEIITLYKQRLSKHVLTEEGNSGLGLLEIARNSAKHFSYEFTENLDKDIFFSIQIIL
jgi:hypothetical protein